MTTHGETESAFDADPGAAFPDLTTVDGVVGLDGPEEVQLDALYLDTPRLDLARAGIALRRRTGGTDEGWHLKVPRDHATEGPRRRTEHRRPLADEVPDELVTLVRSRVRDQPLQPVLELRTRRVVRRVRTAEDDVAAEVTDDAVEARSPEGEVLTTWREWEAELVEGPEDVLDRLARTLAAVPGVRPRRASKLERALGADLPDPRTVVARDGTAREAVRAYVARHVERLLAADAGVRTGDDDAVHDARVSTRRLRAVLSAYRPVTDRAVTDPVRDELAALGHALGEARDAHVERRALRRLLAHEDIELVLGPVAQRIDDDRSVARRDAFDALDDWLASPRHLDLLRVLDSLADELPRGPRADEPAAEWLPRRARKAWKRVDRALAEPPADHDEALHELRKAARRARYASEVAIPVIGAAARTSARHARAVQDALGDQHDTVVRRATLRRIGVQAHLDGENAFTYGRLHALEEAAGREAERSARRPLRRAARRRHRRWMG